jgi:hydrogenase maturation protease
MNPPIVIVGLGQSLRGDDAAGLEAVRYWQRAYPESANHPNLRVVLAELPGLSLLDLLAGAEATILVDAVESGRLPGTIHVLNEKDLAAFGLSALPAQAGQAGAGSGSAHGWGVAETLAMGRLLIPDSLPSRIVLIGIEIGQIELGAKLSEAVQAVLPAAAQLIEEQVRCLSKAFVCGSISHSAPPKNQIK